MRNWIAAALILVLGLSLTACGNGNAGTSANRWNDAAQQQANARGPIGDQSDGTYHADEHGQVDGFDTHSADGEAAAQRVEQYLGCDLMILDDLGTEMITAYSTSALYTLINTRLTRKKATIISTNCSNEELQKKYTPQILSRIEGEYQTLPFVGRDIRQIKKEREA